MQAARGIFVDWRKSSIVFAIASTALLEIYASYDSAIDVAFTSLSVAGLGAFKYMLLLNAADQFKKRKVVSASIMLAMSVASTALVQYYYASLDNISERHIALLEVSNIVILLLEISTAFLYGSDGYDDRERIKRELESARDMLDERHDEIEKLNETIKTLSDISDDRTIKLVELEQALNCANDELKQLSQFRLEASEKLASVQHVLEAIEDQGYYQASASVKLVIRDGKLEVTNNRSKQS